MVSSLNDYYLTLLNLDFHKNQHFTLFFLQSRDLSIGSLKL